MTNGTQSSPTLHCPQCGYNLTGLAQNRCPECGREFDPQVEAARSASQRPIGLAGVLIRLIWPPALIVMVPFSLMGSASYESAIFLLMLAGGNLLVFGAFNARNISRRLAVTRALRAGRGVCILHDRKFILISSIGCYVCQWAIAIGGCGAFFNF